jgi:transposase
MKYLGVDWGSQLHLAVLIDEAHEAVRQWDVEHTPQGVERWLEDLAAQGGTGEIQVALEPGAALLVERLHEVGYRVYLINPKQLDRHRDRYFPSGAKDDARDALVAAKALADDEGQLRVLEPRSDECEELVIRAQAQRRLTDQRVALSNRLGALLRRFHPTPLNLGRDPHDPFFLALLRAYPDPDAARRCRGSRIQRLLKQHRIRALDVNRVLEVLRAPAFSVRAPVVAACRDELINLVRQLQQINEQIRAGRKRMDTLFREHPDHELLQSLPGMGTELAARIGLKLGRNRIEQLDSSILQAHAGTAPVTRSTGKRPRRPGDRPRYGSRIVAMRRACDRVLQADMNIWAAQSRVRCLWAQAFYDHQRAKGAGHNAALRALGNKWIPILAAVMRRREPYDDARYTAGLIARKVPWATGLDPNLEEAA